MLDLTNFYINGKWIPTVKNNPSEVTNPADDQPIWFSGLYLWR